MRPIPKYSNIWQKCSRQVICFWNQLAGTINNIIITVCVLSEAPLMVHHKIVTDCYVIMKIYYILFSIYDGKQNNDTGDFAEHRELVFHKAAYSRYLVSSNMFQTRYLIYHPPPLFEAQLIQTLSTWTRRLCIWFALWKWIFFKLNMRIWSWKRVNICQRPVSFPTKIIWTSIIAIYYASIPWVN